MKLKYYGTAAAEAFPAFFCSCDHCERARKAGGKNIRSRSQALVNDDLLIDFPPDTYMHIASYGLDLRKIENIIITHSHMDHLHYPDLRNVRPVNAKRPENFGKLNVFVSNGSSQKIKELMESDSEVPEFLELHILKPFACVKIGKYDVTPILANHDMKTDPLNFIISDGERCMLYGNDTGYFLDETWAFLEREKICFDYVSLDCTCTGDDGEFAKNHMTLKTCVNVKNRLLQMGCADEKTVFCVHHFSHNGGYTYDELVPVAQKLGFIVSYDTMEVEF